MSIFGLPYHPPQMQQLLDVAITAWELEECAVNARGAVRLHSCWSARETSPQPAVLGCAGDPLQRFDVQGRARRRWSSCASSRERTPTAERHCVRMLRSFEYRQHLCLVFESMVSASCHLQCSLLLKQCPGLFCSPSQIEHCEELKPLTADGVLQCARNIAGAVPCCHVEQ